MKRFLIHVEDGQIEQDLNSLDRMETLPSHLQLPSGGYVVRHKMLEGPLVLIEFLGSKNIMNRGFRIPHRPIRCCDVSSTRMESESYVLDVIPEDSMLLCSWGYTKDLYGRVSERLSPSLYIVPLN